MSDTVKDTLTHSIVYCRSADCGIVNVFVSTNCHIANVAISLYKLQTFKITYHNSFAWTTVRSQINVNFPNKRQNKTFT